MPRLFTDDAPRRLRAIWLGPKGMRWPFDWTYVQWALTVVLVVVFPPLFFGLLYYLNVYLAISVGLMWGPVAAVFAARWIVKRLDFDRPLRYFVRLIPADFRRSRRTPGPGRVLVRCDHIPVFDFAPTVQQQHLSAGRRRWNRRSR